MAGSIGLPRAFTELGALQMVEELMSIADGQIILQRTSTGAVALDFANSLSRMGLRAYAPAMQTLCPPIRLRLAQVTYLASLCRLNGKLGL